MSGGCRWEPFQINEKEYKELKEILLNSGLEEIDTPDWVNNDSDWHIWTFELKTGAPSKEHKRLNDICEEIEKKKKKAIEEGDEEKKIKLHLEYIKAGNDLAEFIMKYT